MGSDVARTNKATKLGRKIDNHQRNNVGVGRSPKGKRRNSEEVISPIFLWMCENEK